MKISGVPGQFTVKMSQEDWTQIQSIQPAGAPTVSGSSNPLSVRGTSTLVGRDGGGGSAPGSVGMQDITVTKVLDNSTPNLNTVCATGTHYPKVTLTVVTEDGENVQGYHVYELENVMVTSYHVSGGDSSEDPPTENVTVNFEEIKPTYSEAETEWQETGYRTTPTAYTYTPRPR
jgi:type VI secretion system secreted protein Hcp